jgi:hypothetical protein
MAEVDQEKTWEEVAQPRFVKLLPNTAMNAAIGAPIGTVELLGRTLNVRCATILDAESMRGMTSKPEWLVKILFSALSQNENPPTMEQLSKLRLSEAPKVNEVVGCFLWAGELSRG